MAWVETLPNGKYRGGWRDSAGRKRYTTPQTLKRQARELAQEGEVKARRQAAGGGGQLSARIPWAEWWVVLGETRTFEASDTDRTEHYIVRDYLMPQWGGIPLNRIEQRHVQDWVNALTAGNVEGWRHDRQPEPGYVRRIYEVFSVSISHALRRGVLGASPCVGVKLPRRRRRPKAYMPMGDAAKLDLPQEYRDAVDWILETGLRPSEMCGLHADRVDTATGWLYVVETLVPRRKVIRPCPKDADVRKVPLSSKALEIYARRVAFREHGGCGLPHTDDRECRSLLVFLTPTGKVMTPARLWETMTDAADVAGLPKRGGYTLRRGWGTRLAERLSPWELARYFGHESLEQTAEYIQETPAARARMLAALGETTPLEAVQGQSGAANRADSDGKAPDVTGPDGAEHAG